jgi:hypothetical protein
MKEVIVKALTDKTSRNKTSLNKVAVASVSENMMSWASAPDDVI